MSDSTESKNSLSSPTFLYGAPEVSNVSLGNRELPLLSNLDLALLMATVNVLSCLPRNWCIRQSLTRVSISKNLEKK